MFRHLEPPNTPPSLTDLQKPLERFRAKTQRLRNNSGLGEHAVARKLRGELLEQPYHHPRRWSALPGCATSCEVRNLAAEPQAQEARERQPVGDLVFGLFI